MYAKRSSGSTTEVSPVNLLYDVVYLYVDKRISDNSSAAKEALLHDPMFTTKLTTAKPVPKLSLIPALHQNPPKSPL